LGEIWIEVKSYWNLHWMNNISYIVKNSKVFASGEAIAIVTGHACYVCNFLSVDLH
jgi:hypothetical protein